MKDRGGREEEKLEGRKKTLASCKILIIVPGYISKVVNI